MEVAGAAAGLVQVDVLAGQTQSIVGNAVQKGQNMGNENRARDMWKVVVVLILLLLLGRRRGYYGSRLISIIVSVGNLLE